jgi:hypothetical protein
VPHYDTAPKDISSNVDPANIIEGSQRHRANAVTLPPIHQAFVIVGEPASMKDPKTFSQAMRRLDQNEWLMAVEVELNNNRRHKVWVVAPMKTGTQLLDTVWVFKRKYNADGELQKYKARLCVRGFQQIEGIDYEDTFAPTGRIASLQTLLGIAAAHNYQVEQMDVWCAFLNGVPQEEIYLKVPDGVEIDVPHGHGLKLQKSLYGLKQSPRCWYHALKTFFLSVNFQPAAADACLFVHQDVTQPCFIYMHVDDLVIVGPNVSFLKKLIINRFEMEDLGPCKWVLGMQVSRDTNNRTISLCQDQYIKEILEEFLMLDCKSASTPLPLNALTTPIDTQPISATFNYRRAVGLINYLVQCTQPDLAFACSYLSQFLNNLSRTHEHHVRHVFQYLKSSIDTALHLGKPLTVSGQIVGYADASYESAVDSASFSGSIIHYFGVIGWRCQKQDNDAAALSTTEAEYRPCSKTGQDIQWLEQLLLNIHPYLDIKQTTAHLYCNNNGALALLKNPQYQHQTRHINVRHHWLRHHIEREPNFTVSYVCTDVNHADFLTKPLTPVKTRQALQNICLKNA